jgi:hypothetical protein
MYKVDLSRLLRHEAYRAGLEGIGGFAMKRRVRAIGRSEEAKNEEDPRERRG